MPRHITITTGARLHFGPLSVGAAGGRAFGGIGVMVDRPGFHIEVSRHETDQIDAGQRHERIQKCLNACRNVAHVPTCRIRVTDAPPAHAGFGAGTQLALAVSAGLFQLSGEPIPPARQLAEITGRGGRSAIGIHGFEQGGFIVDAGKGASNSIGVLACRVPLPESWRFLLITPAAETGLSGEPERAAFERLPPMPAATTDQLCRLVLTEMLPAAHAGDCRAFGDALSEYGSLIGEYFAPEQEGVYAHPRAPEIIERLRASGVTGIAQTSWGPTLCALVDGEVKADAISESLNTDAIGGQATIHIARPLNRGALVRIETT